MVKQFFFKVCPKTGFIKKVRTDTVFHKLLFPCIGLAALLWFCIRVLPKPSRLNYPCQKAAAPLAATFISYAVGLAGSMFALGKARKHFRAYRFGIAIVCVLVGVGVSVFMFTPPPGHDILAEDTGTFTPSDSPNTPIGVARGIKPGRVAWAYDLSACNWDGTSKYWFSTQYNNQAKIDSLLKRVVCSVANKPTVAAAWDTLFKFKNGGAAYVKGEKIAIKINLNNGGNYDNDIDASPESVYSLLDQLVNQFGVNQADITVMDPARENHITAIYDYCKTKFPNVIYDTNLGGFTANCIKYGSKVPTETSISTAVYNTKYLIVMALLKRHCTPAATWGTDGVDYGNAPVTMIFKSNWGIIGPNRATTTMHGLLHDWSMGMNSYHVLVDIEGSKYINGKTVLNILDGLYTGNRWSSGPVKWKMAPFNNHWPSSFFASQDPVALESVGIDFLRTEMPLTRYADRCVHEAALANNPPSGTVYQPDGTRLQSLGAHEHWNNATDKKYTRNLGTGLGIELVQIPVPTTAVVNAEKIMTPVSDIQTRLADNTISVFVPHMLENTRIAVDNILGQRLATVSAVEGGKWYTISGSKLTSGTCVVSIIKNDGTIVAKKAMTIR